MKSTTQTPAPSLAKHLLTGLALGTSLLLAGPLAAQDCLSSQGVEHCPVGDATLHATADGLTVQNHGGSSGVSSRFSPTILWSADMEVPQGEVEHTEMASISGGEATSHLYFTPEGDGQLIRPTFTGNSSNPTYSLLVYRDGVLQASAGGIYAGDGLSNSTTTSPRKIRVVVFGVVVWDSHRRRNRFSIAPTGGCIWAVSFDQAVGIQMPNGDMVQGDEVVFAEEVDGPGHYPYLGFEAIETRSSVSGFSVSNELVEGAG